MRRMAAAIVVVLSVAALHSQTPANSAVIRGRVLAASTGGAVRNAVVRLELSGEIVTTGLTDGDGLFVFSGRASGSYDVSAEKAGLVKTSFASVTGQRLSLPQGGTSDPIELTLAKGGAVSG